MTSRFLLIRVDASVAIGAGHVMRCLALAQAWQDAGGRVVFASVGISNGIRERLTAENCKVIPLSCCAGTAADAKETVSLAQEHGAEWIVVDGYQFNADYQHELKNAGYKVLFVDDYGHAAHYASDLVLNQNAYATGSMYRARSPYTRLLLGPSYCLLRREFSGWRAWKRRMASVGRKVLVTMGGSDPANLTSMIICALKQFPEIEVTIVLGAANRRLEELRLSMLEIGDRFQFLENVGDMAELMALADLLIAGAGSTSWEACFLQLPMLLIDVAENQKPIARYLAESGAAIHLGSAHEVTEAEMATRTMSLLASQVERATLSEHCGKIVDGWGTARVYKELTQS